jgi:DNA ligase-1
MGRQQTLGNLCSSLGQLVPTSLLSGKFFEMPKSVKPAPPQQSSLAELWGPKKQAKNTSSDAPKLDETDMDVDVKDPSKRESSSRVKGRKI